MAQAKERSPTQRRGRRVRGNASDAALGLGVLDDFDVDAVLGGGLGCGLAGIALANEGELNGLGGDVLHRLGQVRHLGMIAFVGRGDVQRQQRAEGIHQRMRL